MRLNEFFNPLLHILNEVTMSPSNLRKLAAETGATAGMEFEMVVPDVDVDEEDREPDMDQDERISDFDDIENFFTQDNNTRREVQRMISSLEEDYSDWASESIADLWGDGGRDYFNDYLDEYFDEEDAKIVAFDYVKENDPDIDPEDDAALFNDLVNDKVKDIKQEWLDTEWDDQGRLYQKAYDSFMENQEYPDQGDWLRYQGYRYMSDLPWTDHDLMWPFYTSSGGEKSLEDVADDFQSIIGRKVKYYTGYHGGERLPGAYTIEPDGSINAGSGESGLEFISPPLPIDDMIKDLNEVIAWARARGCETNNSTGLHMNVSLPNYSFEKLDFVKLALLMGDEYVLNQFGRAANTYCRSALQQVKQSAIQKPEDAQAVLQQMKTGLSSMATKIIHSGNTAKYTSINNKTKYIEFRSPGGDWLNEDIPKLENTLLRFVVALDAACDPEKYRKDYLKKLYALLAPKTNDMNDPMVVFAKYAAGELPQSAMKNFIRHIQTQRQIKKQGPQPGPMATGQWRLINGAGQEIHRFSGGDNQSEAEQIAHNWIINSSGSETINMGSGPFRIEPVMAAAPAAQLPPGSVFAGQWRIVDQTGRELYRFNGPGQSRLDVERMEQEARRWAATRGYGPVTVEPVPATEAGTGQ